jgi:hypothetical protein
MRYLPPRIRRLISDSVPFRHVWRELALMRNRSVQARQKSEHEARITKG